ncbi:hypothetical protein NEUTE1DRAFT_149128 [Neurospora tetrasperma FGSC 2508]|uniref:CCHC-type domain-containing protein n=1 Tax=Neurospora tetrasperma (strain FGSC 2508 / ATCC MYA-4615 / P0657) TaxID=510951 RepID=F8MXW5_NEUT8|nr:uncharacterized protein NEUTE1DRAFT_149128 [Neurospora tetrasperma FGSC 2508]EGO53858.1 hypothetical protein NEUTE1DRAFT_149128 [Neurospora tetrasperma FGSC 2508]
MNEDFQEFRNAFVRLAGECNRPAETWKQEFNWKLPTDIQNALLFGYGEDTVDFTAFVRMAKKCVENSQRLWKSKHKDNKGKDKDKGKDNKNTSSKARGSSSSSSSAAKGSGSQRPPNMSKEEARKLLEENKCFVCKQTGHRFRDCPNKRNNSNRINKLPSRD